MRHGPPPEQPRVRRADEHVPEEVSRRERLHHARRAGVAPHAGAPVHALAVAVRVHHPQREAVDEHRLQQRDDVHIPVVARSRRELRVDGGEEARREERREDAVGEGVDAEGGEDLVRVQGEGA